MRKNILYGDLILQDGKSKIQKNDCVFKEGDEYYKGMKIIEVLKTKTNLNITSDDKTIVLMLFIICYKYVLFCFTL
jgi:hypothetical protein